MTLRRARVALGVLLLVFLVSTAARFSSPYPRFVAARSGTLVPQVSDRGGVPLAVSYRNPWNRHASLPLHAVPELLVRAFVTAEDKRFFQHSGVDWTARGSALWRRVRHGDRTRGASTITEQIVRMLHPRPRGYAAKWIEGLEALALERKAGKAELLEFYLNQVPYASNRRGVTQAARFYFNRDLDTLSRKEILALAVLVRAPSRFDLFRGTAGIEAAILRLAEALGEAELPRLRAAPLRLESDRLPVEAAQFVAFARAQAAQAPVKSPLHIRTTLDSGMQRFVGELLKHRLRALEGRRVSHAAALVADHATREILAWVSTGIPETSLDLVQTPRQPGSALKPFLYAAALERGWTPATVIEDTPYSDRIGTGIHHFHNYSRVHYGAVTLRQALGNSLNIPALHTIRFVTPRHYLETLHRLGFRSLEQAAEHYDDGLALGNGEVSLLELVQGYAALAGRGYFLPLTALLYQDSPAGGRAVFSEEAASLVGHILSDPWARSLEFGTASVLNFPTQTAVKTGTSTDYRDAWAIGYNYRYVAGVWMGNADYAPTDGVTGSLGPALALRGIFHELTKARDTSPLYLSPRLERRDFCMPTGAPASACTPRTEYFLPRTQEESAPRSSATRTIRLVRPVRGQDMALDPRIPAEEQAFEMRLAGVSDADRVEWIVDGSPVARPAGTTLLWPMRRGAHSVQAIVRRPDASLVRTDERKFIVR
jgi:penicillin-binding protein 1C